VSLKYIYIYIYCPSWLATVCGEMKFLVTAACSTTLWW